MFRLHTPGMLWVISSKLVSAINVQYRQQSVIQIVHDKFEEELTKLSSIYYRTHCRIYFWYCSATLLKRTYTSDCATLYFNKADQCTFRPPPASPINRGMFGIGCCLPSVHPSLPPCSSLNTAAFFATGTTPVGRPSRTATLMHTLAYPHARNVWFRRCDQPPVMTKLRG